MAQVRWTHGNFRLRVSKAALLNAWMQLRIKVYLPRMFIGFLKPWRKKVAIDFFMHIFDYVGGEGYVFHANLQDHCSVFKTTVRAWKKIFVEVLPKDWALHEVYLRLVSTITLLLVPSEILVGMAGVPAAPTRLRDSTTLFVDQEIFLIYFYESFRCRNCVSYLLSFL